MTEPNNIGRQEQRGGVISNVLTLMLAGLGAALLVEESAERFVGRLIGQEESLETETHTDAAGTSRQSSPRSTGFIDRQLESVLRVANLPSHSEIARLSDQVEALNRKVDQLNEQIR